MDTPNPGPFMEPEVEPMQVSFEVVRFGPATDGTFFKVCVPPDSIYWCVSPGLLKVIPW